MVVDPKLGLVVMDVKPHGFVKPTKPPVVPTTVPDVKCMPLENAQQTIVDLGFTVGQIFYPGGSAQAGVDYLVRLQAPPAGTLADSGTPVSISVGSFC